MANRIKTRYINRSAVEKTIKDFKKETEIIKIDKYRDKNYDQIEVTLEVRIYSIPPF
jgi:hypothetical protein